MKKAYWELYLIQNEGTIEKAGLLDSWESQDLFMKNRGSQNKSIRDDWVITNFTEYFLFTEIYGLSLKNVYFPRYTRQCCHVGVVALTFSASEGGSMSFK